MPISAVSAAAQFLAAIQDYMDLRGSRSDSVFDIRHRLSVAAIYDVPLFRDASQPLVRTLLGAGNSAPSSPPKPDSPRPWPGLSIPRAPALSHGQTSCRDRIRCCDRGERTRARWFNTAAFALPQPGSFGTSSRHPIHLPGLNQVDASATKNFRFPESHQMQFRAEFFNALNHVNLGAPGLNIRDPDNFGRVTSTPGSRGYAGRFARCAVRAEVQFLTSLRRSRVCGDRNGMIIVCDMRLLALLVAVPLAAQHGQYTNESKNPAIGNPEAIVAGAKLYSTSCAGCHGPDGSGGRGPNLVSRALWHPLTDEAIFNAIRNGVPGADMPPTKLPDDQTWNLVAFVHSLTGPASENNVPGNVEAGKQVFWGSKAGCSNCHSIRGEGTQWGRTSAISATGRWPSFVNRSSTPSKDLSFLGKEGVTDRAEKRQDDRGYRSQPQ